MLFENFLAVKAFCSDERESHYHHHAGKRTWLLSRICGDGAVQKTGAEIRGAEILRCGNRLIGKTNDIT